MSNNLKTDQEGDEVIIIFIKIFGAYCLFLVIIGTLGNLLAMYICMRKKLRCSNTFIFLFFMLGCDTISLYSWSFGHFLLAFNLDKFFSSYWFCRIDDYFEITFLEWSSWLLVY